MNLVFNVVSIKLIDKHK